MLPAAQKILIIGHVWPEPSATAAGKRMLQLINSLNELNYQITFASAALKSEYSLELAPFGVEEEFILLNDPSFDQFLKEASPDIVIFDRFMTEEQYGWRVSMILPGCLQVLNTEDLHSLRSARAQSLKDDIEFTATKWLQKDMAKRELASIYRSDLSLIISRSEMALLKEVAKIPDDLLFYLPFLYDTTGRTNDWNALTYEERSDFIFLGNGKHRPNTDAIQWLYDEIWPAIYKELPKTSLHIYGAYLPANIMALNKPGNGFLVHGYAESSSKVLSEARLNLAPLRFGAGLKGKLVDAMNSGTPSIVTSIAAEGIYPETSAYRVGIDDPSAFAAEAVRIYRDNAEWKRRQQEDMEILNEQFNKAAFLGILHGRLQYLVQSLETHRLGNTVGSLLRHHTMASTKYLSRWIEEKNKRASSNQNL